jgi:hypothetical protein
MKLISTAESNTNRVRRATKRCERGQSKILTILGGGAGNRVVKITDAN